MNKLAPFTEHQAEYIKNTLSNWFNVAEGGKRGGKNVIQTLAFCAVLENHPNKLHLVAGVSQTTAKLNIIDCDGFGLMNYFEGRCREGKYKDRSCLYIKTKTGEKVVLISGGGKQGDEKYIKGNTYGTAYVTEANECHPNFIKEVFDRTISSADRKIFHDLNPKAPQHWYYTDVLDFHLEKQTKNKNYGYNYGHFTIADNLSIDSEKLRMVLKTYQKGTVWYERDILGKRKAAEGLIYSFYADNEENFLIDDIPQDIMLITIGIDYGASRSRTTFKATGFSLGFKNVYALSEKDIEGIKTPEQLYKEFELFYLNVTSELGQCYKVLADYGALGQILTAGLKNYFLQNSVISKMEDCSKGRIIDRIHLVNRLIALGRLKINRRCTHLRDALKTAIWDTKSTDDVRLDDGTTDIDSLDAFEYSIYPFADQLIR